MVSPSSWSNSQQTKVLELTVALLVLVALHLTVSQARKLWAPSPPTLAGPGPSRPGRSERPRTQWLPGAAASLLLPSRGAHAIQALVGVVCPGVAPALLAWLLLLLWGLATKPRAAVIPQPTGPPDQLDEGEGKLLRH